MASSAPSPEASVAEDGPRDDDGSGHGGPMIGVMDPEAGSQPVEAPWESGVEAGGGSQGSDGSDGSGEPAPVIAEARVVMPRISGAGSWLRWPSSSVDRSDPSR